MHSHIEWLFFDIGSTLVDESAAYEHRIRDMIAGTDIPYPVFLQKMLAYFSENKKGDIELARELDMMVPAWHSEDERPYPDAHACLKTLSETYRIGIIANQPAGSSARLAQFGLLPYIEVIAASAEEGVAKPDFRIFQNALQRAKTQPCKAMMIGDRLDNDIRPAKALGMGTVWIKQGFCAYATVRTTEATPDYTVGSLTELLQVARGFP